MVESDVVDGCLNCRVSFLRLTLDKLEEMLQVQEHFLKATTTVNWTLDCGDGFEGGN